jgi:hypothetical protein
MQGIDLGNPLVIGIALCGLCIVGIVLLVVLQVLGGALGLVGGLFEGLLQLLNAGPFAWCGCLVGLIALVGCGGVVWLIISSLASCGTESAVNLCGWLGR